MTAMFLIVPCDPLAPARVDEHFARDAAAARAAGWPVVLVDHDALEAGDGVALRGPVPSAMAVYRGWMLRPGRYAELVAALEAAGAQVLTGADRYRAAHELPGWYDPLAALTPESVWTSTDDVADFASLCAGFESGPAVIRDYSKSAKAYWDEACFIPDVADTAAAGRVASRFRELRSSDFAGGFVLRRFEHFEGVEARTWWVRGVCRAVTAHPDTPGTVPDVDVPFLTELGWAVTATGLAFVTVDVVRRADGVWRVVELGDGQVSDLAATADAALLIDALAP